MPYQLRAYERWNYTPAPVFKGKFPRSVSPRGLQRVGACDFQVSRFRKVFPDGGPTTTENLIKAAKANCDLNYWLRHIVLDEAPSSDSATSDAAHFIDLVLRYVGRTKEWCDAYAAEVESNSKINRDIDAKYNNQRNAVDRRKADRAAKSHEYHKLNQRHSVECAKERERHSAVVNKLEGQLKAAALPFLLSRIRPEKQKPVELPFFDLSDLAKLLPRSLSFNWLQLIGADDAASALLKYHGNSDLHTTRDDLMTMVDKDFSLAFILTQLLTVTEDKEKLAKLMKSVGAITTASRKIYDAAVADLDVWRETMFNVARAISNDRKIASHQVSIERATAYQAEYVRGQAELLNAHKARCRMQLLNCLFPVKSVLPKPKKAAPKKKPARTRSK